MGKNSNGASRRRFLQASLSGGVAGGLAAPALFAHTASATPAPPKEFVDSNETQRIADRLGKLKLSRPRLHFDAAGRDRLRELASSTHRRYANQLFDWVERNKNWKTPDRFKDSELTEVILEESAAFLTNASLAWVLSGKDEHLQLARKWAMAMTKIPRGEVRNFALIIYVAGLARAYDWLYEVWSPAERRRLLDHMIPLTRFIYRGSFLNTKSSLWWAGAHLHHDHWIPMSGLGEVALALLGEDEEAPLWAARAKLDIDFCFSWMAEDGAWHEGPADWCYMMAPLLWFYGAWQSTAGENLHENAWLRNTTRYRIYHRLPDGTYAYLNDSFPSGRYNTSGSAASHIMHRLAALYGDPHAQWLANLEEEFDLKPGPKGVIQAPYETSSFAGSRPEYPHPDSQCVAWNMLWYDPSIPAEPPNTLPPQHHFTNQDVAILRSGWDKDAAVVSFACAPPLGQLCGKRSRAGDSRSDANYVHAHADYNAFTLFARGEYFIIPAGYARRGSYFQNTVAVNGAEFLAKPGLDLHIDAVVNEKDFSYAVGDATAAFTPGLKISRYRRHLVMLDGCLVIYDDLERTTRDDEPFHHFQWALHSDPRRHEITTDGKNATWRSKKNPQQALHLQMLAPDAFAWEKSVLTSLAGKPMLEALRLIRPEFYRFNMRVLAVLSWEDRPGKAELIRDKNILGVRWPGLPKRPTVGFSLSRTGNGTSLAPDKPSLIFDTNPNHPDVFRRRGTGGTR